PTGDRPGSRRSAGLGSPTRAGPVAGASGPCPVGSPLIRASSSARTLTSSPVLDGMIGVMARTGERRTLTPVIGSSDGRRHPSAEVGPRLAYARVVEDVLRAWFAEHGRDLPWRRTRDPYAILVSEVMLQQTQVGRVTPCY